MDLGNTVCFLFGDYVIDAARRELRQGSEIVKVEPQVFDLLLYLIRNRDRVVTKDEVLSAVWPGRIVAESTLFSRIATARHAIGDSGERQRFIRTIARRGFRFVGAVMEESAKSATAKPDAAPLEMPVLRAAARAGRGQYASALTVVKEDSRRIVTPSPAGPSSFATRFFRAAIMACFLLPP